ncbi:MAG: 7-cyano-7-deazaguanine synthase [Frankiaceae bacterium]|nr:7-cyano-7-deazaguanine synthase [Frankiaceae bacterium]
MIAPLLELELDEIRIDLRLLGAGSLASSAPSPHGAHPEFWPYRNQFLVSVAAARALQVGADLVMAGSVSTDDRHVDGSAAFYRQADQLVAMQEGGIHVRAPAVDMTAEALVTLAKPSDEVLSWTHSCHTGSIACGSCGGCIKRQSVLRTTERLQSDVHPK